MPYDPGIQFRGDQYMAQAGQNIGDDLTKALTRYREDKKKAEFNQGIFDSLQGKTDATGKPFIPPEAIARWNSLNPDKQAGYLSSAGAAMQEDQKVKLAQMQIDAANKTSPFAGQKIYNDKGGEVGVYDERGTPHYYPGGPAAGGDTAVHIQPYIDPVTNQPVPGLGIVKGAGNQFQVVNTRGMGNTSMQVEMDPATNVPFFRDAKGNPHPLTADQLFGGRQMKAQKAAESAPGVMDSVATGFKNYVLPTLQNLDIIRKVAPTPPPAAAQAPAPPAPAVQQSAPAADPYIVGKKYKDANGNIATYAGNGQWQ
jgi:hypothetical protein